MPLLWLSSSFSSVFLTCLLSKKEWSLLEIGCRKLPFSTLFNPQTPDRKEEKIERKGATLSLDYFLLIRGVQFLEANLILAIRVSNFFFLFLLCIGLCNKPWPTATSNHPASQGSSIYRPLKSPQNSKCHTITETICSWQNHAPAPAQGKSQSATGDNLGWKQKHILITFCFFFFKDAKIPELSLQKRQS